MQWTRTAALCSPLTPRRLDGTRHNTCVTSFRASLAPYSSSRRPGCAVSSPHPIALTLLRASAEVLTPGVPRASTSSAAVPSRFSRFSGPRRLRSRSGGSIGAGCALAIRPHPRAGGLGRALCLRRHEQRLLHSPRALHCWSGGPLPSRRHPSRPIPTDPAFTRVRPEESKRASSVGAPTATLNVTCRLTPACSGLAALATDARR